MLLGWVWTLYIHREVSTCTSRDTSYVVRLCWPSPSSSKDCPYPYIFTSVGWRWSSWFWSSPWKRDGLSEASPTYPRPSYGLYTLWLCDYSCTWSLSCPEPCSVGDEKWAMSGRIRAWLLSRNKDLRKPGGSQGTECRAAAICYSWKIKKYIHNKRLRGLTNQNWQMLMFCHIYCRSIQIKEIKHYK